MRYLIFACAILFMNCAKHSEEETQQKSTLAEQQLLRDFYCNNLTDGIIKERCDRSTFAHIASAFCPNKPYDTSRFIWAPGEYHRDYKPNTCYNNGSDSECSPDSFITKAHEWISRKDFSSVSEIADLLSFMDKHGHTCGEGPTSLTSILHLKPLFYSVRAYISKNTLVSAITNEDDALPIATHNRYLTALYIYAEGRMHGGIGGTEKAIIKKFMDEDPGSPVFLGLYYRYHDGDQQRALDAMKTDFPSDRVCDYDGYRAWGSSPCAIMQILSTAILEGR